MLDQIIQEFFELFKAEFPFYLLDDNESGCYYHNVERVIVVVPHSMKDAYNSVTEVDHAVRCIMEEQIKGAGYDFTFESLICHNLLHELGHRVYQALHCIRGDWTEVIADHFNQFEAQLKREYSCRYDSEKDYRTLPREIEADRFAMHFMGAALSYDLRPVKKLTQRVGRNISWW